MELRMGCGERDELADQQLGDGQLIHAAQALGSSGHRFGQLGEDPIDRRRPQFVLRTEVVVQQRLGDAGTRRDLARGRTVEGQLREQVERGVEMRPRVSSLDGRVVRVPRSTAARGTTEILNQMIRVLTST
jgi:hypothetical protein